MEEAGAMGLGTLREEMLAGSEAPAPEEDGGDGGGDGGEGYA